MMNRSDVEGLLLIGGFSLFLMIIGTVLLAGSD